MRKPLYKTNVKIQNTVRGISTTTAFFMSNSNPQYEIFEEVKLVEDEVHELDAYVSRIEQEVINKQEKLGSEANVELIDYIEKGRNRKGEELGNPTEVGSPVSQDTYNKREDYSERLDDMQGFVDSEHVYLDGLLGQLSDNSYYTFYKGIETAINGTDRVKSKIEDLSERFYELPVQSNVSETDNTESDMSEGDTGESNVPDTESTESGSTTAKEILDYILG